MSALNNLLMVNEGFDLILWESNELLGANRWLDQRFMKGFFKEVGMDLNCLVIDHVHGRCYNRSKINLQYII